MESLVLYKNCARSFLEYTDIMVRETEAAATYEYKIDGNRKKFTQKYYDSQTVLNTIFTRDNTN